MTRHESAVMGAVTGILCGPFSDLHEYVETILGRPVFTLEMGDPRIADEIRKAARPDFLRIVQALS